MHSIHRHYFHDRFRLNPPYFMELETAIENPPSLACDGVLSNITKNKILLIHKIWIFLLPSKTKCLIISATNQVRICHIACISPLILSYHGETQLSLSSRLSSEFGKVSPPSGISLSLVYLPTTISPKSPNLTSITGFPCVVTTTSNLG